MNKVMNLGKGYLTYGMAVLAIVYGAGSLVLGFGDQDTSLVVLWSGLSLFGVRRAIK